MKRIVDWLGGRLLILLVRLRLALSDAGVDIFARALSRIGLLIMPSRRLVVERNLKRAFGETMDDGERETVLREAYANLVYGFSDLLPLFRQSCKEFTAGIRIEGLEHLQGALARGRGVIAVSAHYGSFPILGAALGARGIPFHFLYRLPKNAATAALFDDWLKRADCRVILDAPRHLAGMRCLKALGEGSVVCILVDQHFPSGVEVPFFGHPAKTGAGAALLAARSRSPLVPMFTRRAGAGRHLIRIEAPIEPPGDRSRKTLVSMTAELTRRVENWIREEPGQWFWIHRRWKDLDRKEDGQV